MADFQAHVPTSLKVLLKPLTNKQATMPLGVSGHRIPNCILEEARLEKELGVSGSEDVEDEDTFKSFTAEGRRKSPPGLQDSVCSKLKDLSLFLSSPPPPPPPHPDRSEGVDRGPAPPPKPPRDLSLVVDVISKNACKYMSLYTFMCGREFRRDEYGTHFRHVHTEIETQLDGWLFRRCPLKDAGCSFGIERMFPALGPPDGPKYKVKHNPSLDSFAVTQSPTEDKDSGEPELILVHIHITQCSLLCTPIQI
jgi:hypothetical protein